MCIYIYHIYRSYIYIISYLYAYIHISYIYIYIQTSYSFHPTILTQNSTRWLRQRPEAFLHLLRCGAAVESHDAVGVARGEAPQAEATAQRGQRGQGPPAAPGSRHGEVGLEPEKLGERSGNWVEIASPDSWMLNLETCCWIMLWWALRVEREALEQPWIGALLPTTTDLWLQPLTTCMFRNADTLQPHNHMWTATCARVQTWG
jgi:hypothetical protein